eukprot:gene5081-18475_t
MADTAPVPEDERRAAIMAKLAEAQAVRKKALAEEKAAAGERATKFGVHDSITCDGCKVRPITGYRYHCTKCKDHDICEDCYVVFKTGKLLHVT